jgi:hypothetical protein
MATRAELVTDLTWLDDAQGLMFQLPQVVAIAADEAYEKSKPQFMQVLRFQPGPTGTPERKIEWTSRKQQQAYFASDGFGGGIPTKRTGGLVNEWVILDTVVGETWQVIVKNEKIASRFVYGSLALSDPVAAARFQQRFHKITGWPLMVTRVIEWFDLIQSGFTDSINIMIGELGTPQFKRRGITPRLPGYRKRKT